MSDANAAFPADPTARPLVEAVSDRLLNDCQDARAATAVWDDLSDALPGLLDTLFQEMQATPEIAPLIDDTPEQQAKHTAEQLAHWKHMLTEPANLNFQGKSIRLAETNIHAGISAYWSVALVGRVLADAVPTLIRKHRKSPEDLEHALQTLISRVFLDVALSQDGYENGVHQRFQKMGEHESDLTSLKGIANTIVDINDLALNMAVLSSNTDEATSNSQSISAAAEELVASVEQIAQTSDQAADDASETTSSVTTSVDSMSTVAKSISEIDETSQVSAARLTDLHEASEQIGGFLAVIQSIADQTNLLALNATIEAARAGEAGKGFAVVASEVKSLATQAAKATEDISHRITALQNGMSAIKDSITGSRKAVERGRATISGANDSIQAVGAQVTDVSTRMHEISTILQQQKTACQEISSNITVADLAGQNRDRLSTMNSALQNSNDNFLDSAQNWFRSDCHRSLVQMAKIDHVFFKKQIVDIVLGRAQSTADELHDHHTCRLGKWYDTLDIKEIRDHAAFVALVDPHKRFHEASKRVVDARNSGDMRKAFNLLETVESASKEVIGFLEELAYALETELSFADGRSHFRRRVEGTRATLATDAGHREVDVVDISDGGLGVLGLEGSELGKTVSIRLNGNEAMGEAVWVDDTGGGGIRLLKGHVSD
jgi:methyl-accepting chemotaxis protein